MLKAVLEFTIVVANQSHITKPVGIFNFRAEYIVVLNIERYSY